MQLCKTVDGAVGIGEGALGNMEVYWMHEGALEKKSGLRSLLSSLHI